MGKRIVLFTTMLGACAGGQIMGMEDKSKCVKSAQFYLSNGLKIKSLSIDAQDLVEKSAKFKGQEFLQTIPLDKSDKLKLKKAFALARSTNQQATEQYTLEQRQYLATITPLIKAQKKKSDKKNFIVEVQPIKQADITPEKVSEKNSTAKHVFEGIYEL